MTDLYYAMSAGESPVTVGALLSIPSPQWMTTPDYRVTIIRPPDGEGWALGKTQFGHQVGVWIRQPSMLAGSHPPLG